MRALWTALSLALLSASPLTAQEAARPEIRAFDLRTTEQLGAAIYRQDSAAWVASDALQAEVSDLANAKLVGWIVVDAADGQKVRFLRRVDGRLEAGYDVDVSPALKTRLYAPVDRALTASEVAMFAARTTASANLAGQPVCRPGYNTVVLKDPQGDGWLAWLLAPMPAANVVPVGGHYRFTISADGLKMLRRDALSASCMTMDPRQDLPAGAAPAGIGLTHVVSPTPTEVHVFLQLQSRLPMMIGAGGRMWTIDQGSIIDRGPISASAKR